MLRTHHRISSWNALTWLSTSYQSPKKQGLPQPHSFCRHPRFFKSTSPRFVLSSLPCRALCDDTSSRSDAAASGTKSRPSKREGQKLTNEASSQAKGGGSTEDESEKDEASPPSSLNLPLRHLKSTGVLMEGRGGPERTQERPPSPPESVWSPPRKSVEALAMKEFAATECHFAARSVPVKSIKTAEQVAMEEFAALERKLGSSTTSDQAMLAPGRANPSKARLSSVEKPKVTSLCDACIMPSVVRTSRGLATRTMLSRLRDTWWLVFRDVSAGH